MTNELFDNLQLLGEPIRSRMVRLLAREEMAVGELARVLQVSQPTVSRHLKQLIRLRFVSSRKVGTATWVHAPVQRYSPAQTSLWQIVHTQMEAEAIDPASIHAADLQRLASVIALRAPDSETLFARLGGRWDALRIEHFGERWTVPLALACIDGRDRHIADLGCGTGHLLASLAATGARVTGIDREAAMLEVARERTATLQSVTLLRGNLDALPLEDQSVDLAVTAFVLHHIRDLPSVFSEVQRVLASHGRAILLDMTAHDRTDFHRTMGHVHAGFSRNDLDRLAAGARLQLQSFRPLPADPNARGPGLFVAVLTHASRKD
ncbi:MAG: hypothetical protein CL927_00540 [Deltaproteobacteria bacterium]|nr:hypothetical protein [Deltaproteobacteria bacterium]